MALSKDQQEALDNFVFSPFPPPDVLTEEIVSRKELRTLEKEVDEMAEKFTSQSKTATVS